MIIAKEKKKNNIAEYILYMYQIEDIIRANKFDMSLIKSNVIDKFQQPDDIKEEMYIWYSDLIAKMKNEEIEHSGHLQFLKDTISELDALHENLLQSPDELKYIDTYNKAKPAIKELKSKIEEPEMCDIEICLNGLYALLLMKLRNQKLNKETVVAMDEFRNLVTALTKKYHSSKLKR